jgi:hypothetical protein
VNIFQKRVLAGGAAAIATAVQAVMAGAAGEPKSDASCIAIVMPVVQGMPGNAGDVAAGVRDVIANLLDRSLGESRPARRSTSVASFERLSPLRVPHCP